MNNDINKKISQFIPVDKLDKTTLIPIVQGAPLFNAIISSENLAKSLTGIIEQTVPIKIKQLYETKSLAEGDIIQLDLNSLPLEVGYFIAVTDDSYTENNGIYIITGIETSGLTVKYISSFGEVDINDIFGNYIGFEIDNDMNLVMTTPDNYDGVEFELINGELNIIL